MRPHQMPAPHLTPQTPASANERAAELAGGRHLAGELGCTPATAF